MDTERLKTEALQLGRQLKDAIAGIVGELKGRRMGLRADRFDRDCQAFGALLQKEAEKLQMGDSLELRSAYAYPCVHVRKVMQDRFGERPRDIAMFRELCTHQGEAMFARLYGKKGAKERPPSMEGFLIDFAAFAGKLWDHGAPRKLMDAMQTIADPVEKQAVLGRLCAQYFAVGQDAKRKLAAAPEGAINALMRLHGDVEGTIKRVGSAPAEPAAKAAAAG